MEHQFSGRAQRLRGSAVARSLIPQAFISEGGAIFVSNRPSPKLLYRLGTILVEISDRRITRISFVLAVGLATAAVDYLIFGLLLSRVGNPWIAELGAAVTISLFVSAITYVEVEAIRERRRAVVGQMRDISELHHNVRNALQTIQYATRFPNLAGQIEVIDESIARISKTIDELYPLDDKEAE